MTPPPSTCPALALGVVTFGTPSAELAHLARSIELAAARLERPVALLTLDNGAPGAWPATSFPRTALEPQGNVGFARGMNRLLADGPVEAVLADVALLLSANVIHEHGHRHGALRHSHPHHHASGHTHEHGTGHTHDPGSGHTHEHG